MSSLPQPSSLPLVALLTGAGREPIRSLAVALAAHGTALALTDLTPMGLEETAALLPNGQVTCHVSDPSKGLAAHMLIEEVLDAWGRVDIVVNCPRAEPHTPLLELDEWDWQRTLEANLNAPFLLMQTLGNWMKTELRPGTMLNILNAAAMVPTSPARTAYSVSQMGLAALTRSAALELLEYNISVNGVCLGEPFNQKPTRTALAQMLAFCNLPPSCPTGQIVTPINEQE